MFTKRLFVSLIFIKNILTTSILGLENFFLELSLEIDYVLLSKLLFQFLWVVQNFINLLNCDIFKK